MSTFLLDHMQGCTPLNPCASCEAANFLRSKLSKADFSELIGKIQTEISKKGPYGTSNPVPLEAPLNILDIAIRTANCLKADNTSTIGDLIKKKEIDLLKVPNLGRKSFNEIKEALEKVGRHLGEIT